MKVFQEVWHRIQPPTANAYHKFINFYDEMVLDPKNDYLDIVAAWRHVGGETNTDVYLYRFPSIAEIEVSMGKFGLDPKYHEVGRKLFSEIRLEEHREIRVPIDIVPEQRLNEIIVEKPDNSRRYVQLERRLDQRSRADNYPLLKKLTEEIEKHSDMRMVLTCCSLIGHIERLTEYWVLPEGQEEFVVPEIIENELLLTVNETIPEKRKNYLAPLFFSKLQ